MPREAPVIKAFLCLSDIFMAPSGPSPVEPPADDHTTQCDENATRFVLMFGVARAAALWWNLSSMTSGGSNSPEQVPELPAETIVPPPPSGDLAARLRGFGPLGIVAILVIVLTGYIFVRNVIVPIGAILVLVWVRLSQTPWREIGYVRPRSWTGTVALGLAFGIAFKFLMKAIVMPLLGADPINQADHYLAGNQAMLPAAVWAMLVAGFAE